MRMREAAVEEQIQWVLSYMQRGLADIQKENILEDLEAEILEYVTVGEFLVDLKKKFEGGDNKMMKMAELKKVEQRNRMMEEFVQEFRRTARDNRYKGRLLVEKFKREINGVIRKKLIGTKWPPRSIEQQYKRAVNLDRYWRKSRREEERLRGRRETEALAQRTNIPVTAGRTQGQ